MDEDLAVLETNRCDLVVNFLETNKSATSPQIMKVSSASTQITIQELYEGRQVVRDMHHAHSIQDLNSVSSEATMIRKAF